jgi:hypothetical protein
MLQPVAREPPVGPAAGNFSMSSSIAAESKAVPKNALANLDRASHGHRVDVLAQRIAMHVESLVPRGRARCLDIGCGDMSIADAVRAHASRTDWRCIDVNRHPAHLHSDAGWSQYGTFDGRTIPYGDREFDIGLLCDMLHHAPGSAAGLLAEAARVARRVIVKDHFEDGACSRTMQRVMEFAGNRGYGGGVPPRYLTREEFVRLAAEQRLVITAFDCDLDLDHRSPLARTLFRPDWHFIAVLGRP